MILTTILVFLVTFLLAYLLCQHLSTPANLPPGPTRWPLLGSIPYLTGDIKQRIRDLGKKYGDIFTIYMGNKRTVVINSFEMTKDAYVKLGLVFGGRPQDLFFIEHITKGLGVISSQGEIWQNQRRVSHRILRDFGLGKNIMEEKILTEVSAYIEELKKHTHTPFNIAYLTQAAVANIIWSIVSGFRHEYHSPKFIKYVDIMNKSFELCGTAGPLNVFPFLKYLPGDIFKCRKLDEMKNYMDSEFQEEIDKHKMKDNQQAEDFIDAYRQEIRNHQAKEELKFNETNLLRVIGDMFGAGAETVTSTLMWILVYMLHYPEAVKRMQLEIDDVIGTRTPSMRDKVTLPYVEAFINEVHRMACVVPLGVPHSVMEDVHFQGYFIPKDTTVISTISSIHFDERYWEEPFVFKPERFLDANNQITNTEKLIPFSFGKRVCLGEALARMELFLFVTSLLQNFSICLPPGATLPSTEGILSITHRPFEFQVVITHRNH